MKAIGCLHPFPATDLDSLQDVERTIPHPQLRDLLVRVSAVSVNPVDTKIRRSQSTGQNETVPRVLGWDAAGVVESVGPSVSLFRVGDEVYYSGSLSRPGANSEYHLVDERLVAKKPASINMAQAAALPLTAITAYEALFDRLGISPQGESGGAGILIIGGAGGVGSLAIQLAKIAKLYVIATASRHESQTWCRKMGADAVIDHTQSIPDQLKQVHRPIVEYIFNTSQTDQHWQAMCEAIKPQGRICGIVDTTKPVNLNALKRKSATFVWEFMFTRSMYETDDMIEQHHLLTKISKWIDERKIQSTLTETLSPINAANLRSAHAKLESGKMIGKFVLTGWPT
ncbi:MAG: zinc-binding alcohol dehydrogenase family protein [Nitrospirota bacterium]|nr:zinc-binding alcohol dehydrogenase family protein [Nitrospirota bacterium]MDH5585520.1 zinc-binding alcohol dehydrogenase family protein [Nitrospirota bacterium]MDH5773619.1 zinc-binding alcohol dehydrogenase family protein [Nitrospirota bacterium]